MKRTIEQSCDCLVIGGGTAGVVAAIQAARAGARTTLIEMNPVLGGTMTMALVSSPQFFFARGRQVVAGIGWALVKETIGLSDWPMPDLTIIPPTRPGRGVLADHRVFPLVAEEACLKAGVELHYQEMLLDLQPAQDGWLAEVAADGLLRRIAAREVIDCTGTASAVRLAGGECVKGDRRQPGTLEFHLTGYNAEALDADQLERAYQAALASGELKPGDFCYADQPFINYLKGAGGANRQHLFNADDGDAASRTAANIAGRQRLLAMLRFLRRQPGLEKCTIARVAPMTGVRESWRIVGDRTITEEDYLTGKMYDDAVAWTYYFVDRHHETGVERKFIPEGVWPSIPLGALLPRGLDRILVAGRTISSDQAAHSGLRVEVSCMGMGQAAGAAAALACRLGCPSRDVPLADLRRLLREHGALVPDPQTAREPAQPLA